jgi:hypothetical protein
MAKVMRAHEHTDALRHEMDRYIRAEAHTIRLEYDAHASVWIVRLEVRQQPDYQRWATIIGDAVQNYRAALDHVAWQIARKKLGWHDPPRKVWPQIQFPLALTEQSWEGRRTTTTLDHFTEAGRALIENVQPYKRGKRAKTQGLAYLNALSNEDKHRILPVTQIVLTNILIASRDPGVALQDVATPDWVVLEDGAEIGRFRAVSAAGTGEIQKIDLDFDFARFVALRDGTNILNALETIEEKGVGVVLGAVGRNLEFV